jgi:uncharacterized cupredoxin-like copper-binding protein
MSARLSAAVISLSAMIAIGGPLLTGFVTSRAVAHAEHAFAAGEPGDPKKPFRTVEIAMTEGLGTMTYSLSSMEVRKGEQIKFVLKNAGHLAHEFLLDSVENNAKHKIQMEKHPDMEHDEPNGKKLEPKASSEIVWRFTKAGTFEFACLIPGHYEAGMKGVVVVK